MILTWLKLIGRITLFIVLFQSKVISQHGDSTFQVIQNMDDDTTKVNAFISYLDQFYSKDFERAYKVAKDALKTAKKINYVNGMKESYGWLGFLEGYFGNDGKALDYYEKYFKVAEELKDFTAVKTALNNMANIYSLRGNDEKAIQLFKQCIALQKENDELKEIGAVYLNLGQIYNRQGNFERAFDYAFKGLRAYESDDDISKLAEAQNMVGLLYRGNKDYKKAKEYFELAMKNSKKTNNIRIEAQALNNLGLVFKNDANIEEAINSFQKSLKIRNSIGDLRGQAESSFNLARIYRDKGDLDSSNYYFEKSSSLDEKTGDMMGLIQSEMGRGDIELRLGNSKNALNYYTKALKMAEEVGYVEQLKNIHFKLIRFHKSNKDYKEALRSYVAYDTLKYNLLDQENSKIVARKEAKYEYDKKAFEDSLRNAQNEMKLRQDKKLQQERIEKQNFYIFSGGVGLFLLTGLVLALFKSNRIKQKSNDIINAKKQEVERQKNIVEEKNKEILDSIRYAKRIQTAILPPGNLVKKYLNESFILYLPKDVVAGDFYWMESSKDAVLIASADCTGHGVPGAMVSVICNNGLNRSVREYKLSKPSEILDKTREIVVNEFEKSEEDVKDGMDIALVSINYSDKENVSIQYAGANNPLWIVRKGQFNTCSKESYNIFKVDNSSYQVLEVKANKQPIGNYMAFEPFTNHELDLKIGDNIYLFSDGFSDQFGGEKGKKYKSANFKKLLLNIQDRSMDEQKKVINKEFQDWKGELEQVDDVCVIGVRL